MKKSEVLKAIDDVMNNREIDSIRNAILAIRDKVLEMEDDSEYYARLKLRGNNPLNLSVPYFDGATHNGWNDHIEPSYYVEIAYRIDDEWRADSDEYKIARNRHEVVAWMPLPKPWNGERREDDNV